MQRQLAVTATIATMAINLMVSAGAVRAQAPAGEAQPVQVDTNQVTGQNAATFQPTSKIYDFFNGTNKDNMQQKVEGFYAATVEFEDPFTKINGRQRLLAYYEGMYKDLESISFDIKSEFQSGDETVALWTMTLQHKDLAGGAPVIVDGVSYVRFENDKAVNQRDYFDAGAMLYEHVPIVGSLIRWLKGKMAGEG